VTQTIDVVVDGDAGEAGADRGVGDTGVSNDRLAKAAGLKSLAVSRGRTSGAGARQLDAEGAFNAGVGQQLLRGTEVRTDNVAVNNVTLLGSDVQIANQYGVGAGRSRIRSVRPLRLDQDQAFPQ